MPDIITQEPTILRDPLGQQLHIGDIVVWAKASHGAGVNTTYFAGEHITAYYRVVALNKHVSIHLLDQNKEPMAGRGKRTSVPPLSVIKVDKILGTQ